MGKIDGVSLKGSRQIESKVRVQHAHQAHLSQLTAIGHNRWLVNRAGLLHSTGLHIFQIETQNNFKFYSYCDTVTVVEW